MGGHLLTRNCLLLIMLIFCVDCQNKTMEQKSYPSLTELPMEVTEFNGTLYATCEVRPVPNLPPNQPEIYGQVLFKQAYPHGTLQVAVNLRGLSDGKQQAHAIHVHRFGDLSDGCITAGPHYNPVAVDHPGHPGDLGNFAFRDGRIRQLLRVPGGTLFGGRSMLGRAVVVHEKEDDMGLGPDEESKRSGNAGKRIAGCVIGLSSPSLWEKTVEPSWEDVESRQ
ncbi:extracellular superoxide dismutase [Cu-Zn] [Chanos chanos]|uniref:Extracellular superoxide dismutase [Cu-Zn] n=1 Tax=Chanos chanos TaxID=29144 RepID=A0A6J2VW45_CHACN|nr:extracellular superoxide dismutase [Cu-Zn] [Chanos chanos]